MRLLLDTHVIFWVAYEPHKLSAESARLLSDPRHELEFSVAVLWEIAVKNQTRRALPVDPEKLRRRLLERAYVELPIAAEHALAVRRLPRLHGDPFDRIMMAQAIVEGCVLLTADRLILRYPSVPTMAL